MNIIPTPNRLTRKDLISSLSDTVDIQDDINKKRGLRQNDGIIRDIEMKVDLIGRILVRQYPSDDLTPQLADLIQETDQENRFVRSSYLSSFESASGEPQPLHQKP